MNRFSRRGFLAGGACALPLAAAVESQRSVCEARTVSLCGEWEFRLDGEAAWTKVRVPHTWQTAERTAGYAGVAWYRRELDVPAAWAGKTVRVEFEAVFHSATVWLNEREVGRHIGKGYTAFTLDLTPALRPGAPNVLMVRVDNAPNDRMLPRGNSYDWTNDGGIYRPVTLLVSGPVYIERLEVDASPEGGVEVRVHSSKPAAMAYRVLDEATGRTVLAQDSEGSARLDHPRLWHFDDPQLYRLEATLLDGGRPVDSLATTFGFRRFETRGPAFHLNGERVRLMGVERMAGSNPLYGMAEPETWIAHDHDDLKELNCVFTRVHWQQDRRVLDYCDRHGILVQLEVPAWGPETFKGAGDEAILENGLEQLREMIARDRNHPCVVAWGLCNEVNGQNPAAQKFIRRMNEEAKKLDPRRLTTYASNSLEKTPERDAAGELDFISWNEYYESWYGGGLAEVRANLEAIHRAFPEKPIVVSEYGYCECAPGRTGGDAARARILKEHTEAYRERDYTGGAIFFCYNDYRTIVGDKGAGVLKQRVHGVVDVYGSRKPSFEELRRTASPVSELAVAREGGGFTCRLRARNSIPAYTLRGYKLRWIGYGFGDLPMEQFEDDLAPLAPGAHQMVSRGFSQKDLRRVRVEVVRPTGFPAATAEWSG